MNPGLIKLFIAKKNSEIMRQGYENHVNNELEKFFRWLIDLGEAHD